MLVIKGKISINAVSINGKNYNQPTSLFLSCFVMIGVLLTHKIVFYFVRIMKPEGDEAKELEEILAKRQKKGKVDDDKPLEERSILHSKFCVSTTPFLYYLDGCL